MKRKKTKAALLVTFLLYVIFSVVFRVPHVASDMTLSVDEDAIGRGSYLVVAGGCVSCHRGEDNPQELSGGLALETEFGTFYAPNITPDENTGTGNWTAEDYLLALKHGRTSSGSYYYPAFPYRAYAGLTDEDILDIASYLSSLDAVHNEVPEPEVPFWLNRWLIRGWNLMADVSQAELVEFDDELVARGAYLARHLGHCGECHTPRNGFGIPLLDQQYAGAQLGEERVEPIDAQALDTWTAENFDLFLLLGMKPDGEFVGGDMNDVIEHNTSKISDADRSALAAFFTRHAED